jgi:uncharacterized protein YdaU (DUF1376 family)
MSNELDFIPWYVAKFLVAVASWPPDRVGAYVLALNWQVEHGGIPARNLTELASILHTSRPKAQRLWAEIQHKFIERDGLWWNEKAETVKADAVTRFRKSSDRGRAGANARWNKHSSSDAQAPPKQSVSNSSTVQHSTKTPPKPPADAGGSRRRRRREGDPIAIEQYRKTQELNRLIGEGVPRPDALRRAGF